LGTDSLVIYRNTTSKTMQIRPKNCSAADSLLDSWRELTGQHMNRVGGKSAAYNLGVYMYLMLAVSIKYLENKSNKYHGGFWRDTSDTLN